MLLLDNLLLSPLKGLKWVFEKVHEFAQQEIDSEAEKIKHSLSEIYLQLEAGNITEEEFTSEEKVLLDRLDEIWERENMSYSSPQKNSMNELDSKN